MSSCSSNHQIIVLGFLLPSVSIVLAYDSISFYLESKNSESTHCETYQTKFEAEKKEILWCKQHEFINLIIVRLILKYGTR